MPDRQSEGLEASRVPEEQKETKNHNWVTSAVSGTAAGAISATLFHPISVLQTRFQGLQFAMRRFFY